MSFGKLTRREPVACVNLAGDSDKLLFIRHLGPLSLCLCVCACARPCSLSTSACYHTTPPPPGHSHTNWGRLQRVAWLWAPSSLCIVRSAFFPAKLQPPFFINGPDVVATHGDDGGGGGRGGSLRDDNNPTQLFPYSNILVGGGAFM